GNGGNRGGQAGNQNDDRNPAPARAANANDGNGNGGNGNGGNGNNNRRRPQFDPNSPEAQAMQKQMREGFEEQTKARKEAEAAVGKVLLPAQKKKFNGLLGAKYDLTKLVEGENFNPFGFGGRGGPGGGRGGNNGNGGRGGNNQAIN